MKIVLCGVACVGKATVGRLLADRLGCKFFDFPLLEGEKYFDIPITFLQQKCELLLGKAKEE